ncbi:MAG: HEAT repeat domain-containing protein, partial [Phycisphaerales bacterium]|nr:HEAT repeat domain-containing protein [Phycisphaerales bacterium]
MGNNITPLQWIGLGVLGVLVLAVAWQWGLFGGDSDPEATEFARIEAYARADDSEALVREVTDTKDVKRVCRSVRTMGRLGSIAIKGIRVAMKDERSAVREAAMIAVSKAGDEKDTPVMATAVLEDNSPEVRAAAVMSLGRMGA